MNRIVRPLVAGFLVLLPLALTVALMAWIGDLLLRFVGPGSAVGQLLTRIGLGLTEARLGAYLLGIVVVAAAIYLVGIVVESRLERRLSGLIDAVMRRIPLVGRVYGVTKSFVGMVDRREGDGLQGMSPVWCFFGGEGGVAVLGLLPAPDPIVFGGQPYHAVLVPTAPVPIGGGLLYVPAAWVRPAEIGVDGLVATYVSMGVAPPRLPAAGAPPPVSSGSGRA
jgi:uncharacterized membrane protein